MVVNQLSTWNGRAILPQPPDLTVETDASLLGWGAVSEGIRTGGLWSEEERAQHINLLELKGGAMAVKTFAKHERNMSDCRWTTRPQSFTSTAWGELDLKTLYTQCVSYGSGASSRELLSRRSIYLE